MKTQDLPLKNAQRFIITLVVLSIIGGFLCSRAIADSPRAAVFSKNGQRCNAVGIKQLGEYLGRKDLRCFRNIRKAEAKGFIAADLGILSNEPKPTIFEFQILGSQAVPPAATSATGSCTGVLNAARDNFRLLCSHSASTADKAHVHLGVPGEIGPKVCIANSATSPIAWDCPFDASNVDALINGELYVNIHSTDFPKGELRSQIQ